MRRLYITGYTQNGIRQYALNESKVKAKTFEYSKKSQTGSSKVFTTFIECKSREDVDTQKELYKEINNMLKIKSGDINAKGEFKDVEQEMET